MKKESRIIPFQQVECRSRFLNRRTNRSVTQYTQFRVEKQANFHVRLYRKKTYFVGFHPTYMAYYQNQSRE